jgi:hypothetical protein
MVFENPRSFDAMFFLNQNFTHLFCVRFPKASTVLSMCRSTPKVFHIMMSSTFTSWPLPSLCFSKTNDTMGDETDWRVETKTEASTCPCFALPFSKLIKLSMYESSGVLQIKTEQRCFMFFSAILLQDIKELEDALVWRVMVCRK